MGDGITQAEVPALLLAAQRAREGRDLWRAVGPTLAALVEAGISYTQIAAMTGISEGTAHRLVARACATSSSSPSTDPASTSATGSSTASLDEALVYAGGV